MSAKVHVGIDCGDLGFRVSYVADSNLFNLKLPSGARAPAILFDAHANISSIGVGFPSIMRLIGTRRTFRLAKQNVTPELLIEKRLKSIREEMGLITDRQIEQTVMAVPATLSEHRRKALVDSARKAGWGDVTLIDRCTAVALGFQSGQSGSNTVLVFDAGYGGCEYSLVRLAKGRCRVIATGATPDFSGELLDALTMEAVVLALRNQNLFLGLRQLTSTQWHEFRYLAEAARHELSRSPQSTISLVPELTGLGKSIEVRLAAEAYAARLKPLLEPALDGLQGLLEQGEIELGNVDAFLLAGGVATNSPVRELMRQAFESMPQIVEDGLVDTGAAWRASQNADQPLEIERMASQPPMTTGGMGAGESRTAEVSSESGTNQRAIFAEVITPVSQEAPPALSPKKRPSETADQVDLGAVRGLLAAGESQKAEELLDKLIAEAEKLKKELRSQELTGPLLALQQARSLLNAGRFVEAVARSHEAYDQAQEDPEVFAGMMKIHADAGLALNQPEEYAAALKILGCAHNHDQTDRSIHQALAERHFKHAIAQQNLNNLSQSLEAIDKTLQFNPKHSEANRLLEELSSEEPSDG